MKNTEMGVFKGHSEGHTVTQRTQTEHLYGCRQRSVVGLSDWRTTRNWESW